jgi:hypothetical protein
MLKAFFGNLIIAALIASIHFAPQPVVLIAEFVGTAYGLIVTPILFLMGGVLLFKEPVRKKHATSVVELRQAVRFLDLRRWLYRLGFVLVILAGVSVGWTEWAGWMACGFAMMLVGFYVLAVSADKLEAELKRLREENEILRADEEWRTIDSAPDDHFPVQVWSIAFGQCVAFRDVNWTWFPVPATEPLPQPPSHWAPLALGRPKDAPAK